MLRAELGPGAEIGGPSFGSYNHDAMAAFLEFCLARGCEVNALIFHAADDSPAGLAAFPANVQDARMSFLENPRYAPLRIRRIINNEIVGPLYTHQPAGTLAYYAAFEASGAALAARSCWPENIAAGECYGTLDGLLTPAGHAPAAVGLVGALALRGGRALPRRGDGQHGQPGRAQQRRLRARPAASADRTRELPAHHRQAAGDARRTTDDESHLRPAGVRRDPTRTGGRSSRFPTAGKRRWPPLCPGRRTRPMSSPVRSSSPCRRCRSARCCG